MNRRPKKSRAEIALLGVILLWPALANGGDGASAWLPCPEWLESISDYDAATDRVVGGEPEDALAELVTLWKRGEAVERDLPDRSAELASITPPEELVDLHSKLIAYFRAVEGAAAASVDDGAAVPPAAMKECYQALYDYYRELEGILAERRCNEGDLEALRETILPRLKTAIESLSADATSGG